ncbi:MAG: 50S ribosomal protein L9 [Acidimicrobiia bacterium]
MKVVLRSDVDNVGSKGDIVDVADGFARNFLVRKGLAIAASDGAVRQAEAMRRNRAARDARERATAEDLATRLQANRIQIAVRAGEGGKLFGSVSNADIAAALAKATGATIDRKTVQLADAIKSTGAYEVAVRLHPAVSATVGVDVVAE